MVILRLPITRSERKANVHVQLHKLLHVMQLQREQKSHHVCYTIYVMFSKLSTIGSSDNPPSSNQDNMQCRELQAGMFVSVN
jgi:hypothetical protein